MLMFDMMPCFAATAAAMIRYYALRHYSCRQRRAAIATLFCIDVLLLLL